jgi:hypothetical protein
MDVVWKISTQHEVHRLMDQLMEVSKDIESVLIKVRDQTNLLDIARNRLPEGCELDRWHNDSDDQTVTVRLAAPLKTRALSDFLGYLVLLGIPPGSVTVRISTKEA